MQTSASSPRLTSPAESINSSEGDTEQHHSLPTSVQQQPHQRAPTRPRRSMSLDPSPPPQPPLKERLYTALTRFRYGWNLRSSVEISAEEPIWLLGKCYHQEKEKSRANQDMEGAPPHILAFMDHFNSLIWMTYRTNFPVLPRTTITTDCGWGCMVRSGQMILGTTLNRFLLGREWRFSSANHQERVTHRQMLSWFADHPSPQCPFSLHALMRVAVQLGHTPGDWFGPSQLAILIRECVMESRKTFPQLQDLLVYVAHDCTVYVGDVMKLYEERHDRAMMVLVPVRLGSEALNPIYIPCVKSLLAMDHCVGIIGGKPKHSVYFVGFQKNKLVHLDPHYCQVATEPGDPPHYKNFDVKTYHCSTPRKLAASRMDPSCTIGFLCPNLQEFHNLRKEAEKVLAPPLQKGVYPFFSFSDQSLDQMLNASVNMRLGSLAEDVLMLAEGGGRPLKGRGRRRKGRRGSDILDGVVWNDEEDFVVVECAQPQLPEGEGEGEGEWVGDEGSSSQGSDGEIVFLTKSDTLSSGVQSSGNTGPPGKESFGHVTSGNATNGDMFGSGAEERTTVGGGAKIEAASAGGGARPGPGREGEVETVGASTDGTVSGTGDVNRPHNTDTSLPDETTPLASTVSGTGDDNRPHVIDTTLPDETTPPASTVSGTDDNIPHNTDIALPDDATPLPQKDSTMAPSEGASLKTTPPPEGAAEVEGDSKERTTPLLADNPELLEILRTL